MFIYIQIIYYVIYFIYYILHILYFMLPCVLQHEIISQASWLERAMETWFWPREHRPRWELDTICSINLSLQQLFLTASMLPTVAADRARWHHASHGARWGWRGWGKCQLIEGGGKVPIRFGQNGYRPTVHPAQCVLWGGLVGMGAT